MPKSTTWITGSGLAKIVVDANFTWTMILTVRSLGAGATYQEVVGLNVAIDEVLLVNSLGASDLCKRDRE